MARGVLGGMLVGGAVSVVSAVAISAIIGPPVPPGPDVATVEVTPGSGFQDRREDRAAEVPAATPQPAPATAPAVSAPEPEAVTPMVGADTDPGAQPMTGTVQGALSQPPAEDALNRVEVATDAPVLSSPQARLPAAPEAETAPDTPGPAAMPTPPAAPETGAPQAAESVEAQPAEVAPEVGPEVGAEAENAASQVAEEASREQPEQAAQEQAAQTDDAPDDAPIPAPTAEAAPQEPAPQTAESEVAEATEPAETPAQDELAGRPSIGRPATSLVTRDATPEPDAPATDAAPDETAVDLPPVQAFAADFENPEGKPLMSIVLIDRGEYPQIVEALDSFPYPVSFAVDPAWKGAPEAMARYRAAGRDVLALVDLPQGATAGDVEVNLAALLGQLPEAVAVLEGDDTGLQGNRAVADQVTAWLRDSGHGLVMYPQGLDTVRKLAEKEGVPAATLFRDFDAKGQGATVIRRFLDQAAFKAGQEEGGVVMVGRARPETISALILWGLADRAERVALAPVSALLLARDQAQGQ